MSLACMEGQGRVGNRATRDQVVRLLGHLGTIIVVNAYNEYLLPDSLHCQRTSAP